MADKVEYQRDGIIYIELLPDGALSTDYGQGIPLSPRLDDLEALYPSWTPDMREQLLKELQRRGLISFIDFLRPTATKEVRAAINAVLKPDTIRIIDYMREAHEL